MAEADTHQKPGVLDCFITLPDEKLILAERKHWLNTVSSIIIILLTTFPFYFLSFFLFYRFFNHPALFISTILIVGLLTISLIVKVIIDWYFHLFIVTNRKILEVYYSPLFFYRINGVLLDQVRCTEIDEKKHGILNEIIDMGDIIITFDRPTHQEEFIFKGIKNPRKIATLLSNMFADLEVNSTQPIWYKFNRKESLFPLNKKISGKYSLEGR